MKKNIALYCDEGAGAFSLFCARDYFSDHRMSLITANDIIQNGIPDDTDIFVMPGGADKPYAKKLNGQGNQNIRSYVEQGGIYIGICAGAYYGCSSIEFQKGTPREICEKRELQFYKGAAIGCLNEITTPYDLSLKSAAITRISTVSESLPVFYWGGCHLGFENASGSTILAQYESIKERPAAIISCAVGKGIALLSGVHFEVSAKTLRDYNFENEEDNHLKNALADQLEKTPRLKLDDLLNQTQKEAA